MELYLLGITVVSIIIVILGVSWWKWHAFISLTVAGLFLAIFSGLQMGEIVDAYEAGVGDVLGHLIGILALGTILGKMMSDSGAGMQVADFLRKDLVQISSRGLCYYPVLSSGFQYFLKLVWLFYFHWPSQYVNQRNRAFC